MTPTATLTPPPRRRGAPDRGTRERILRATLQIINQDGIAAIRNARVAELAGVSPGSLTYCFTSQAEFLREALMLYVREEANRHQQAIDEFRSGKLTFEQLAQQIEAMIGDTLANRQVGAQFDLYLHATRDPELRAAAAEALATYDQYATAALQAADIPNPERHAPTLIALSDGLTLRYLAENRTSAEGIATAFLTYLHGIQQNTPAS